MGHNRSNKPDATIFFSYCSLYKLTLTSSVWNQTKKVQFRFNFGQSLSENLIKIKGHCEVF